MELKKTLQTKVQYDHKIKDAMTKDERENNTMLEGNDFNVKHQVCIIIPF